MNHLEKQTLKHFLYLYLGTVLLFLATVGYYHYSYEKNRIIKEFERSAREQKGVIVSSLMRGFACQDIPKSFLLYDNNTSICDNLASKVEPMYEITTFVTQNRVNLVTKAPPRIASDGYILIQSEDFSSELIEVQKTLFYFFIGSILFFGFSGWFLSKLILKPWSLAKQQLEDFIKDATHDLKTPISSAMLSLERLKDVCMKEDGKKYVEYANASIKTLLLLYEDLVYINFKERNTTRVAHIDISKLVADRMAYLTSIAQSKNIQMSSELVSLEVQISHKDATRMVDNLLSNAIKYNKVGGFIKVVIEQNRLKICDNGIGIPKEKLQTIFERYGRANTSSGGFGLGLAIVKEICERNHIKIEVNSIQNEGTTFMLTF